MEHPDEAEEEFRENCYYNCSPTFLKRNSVPQLEVSGIEMVIVPTVSYTSLRDIMPHPNNASWNQIPIKNPLLKQAALAYLQPMSTPPEVGNKGFLDKLKDKCFCGDATTPQFGCFRWLNGSFFNSLLAAFLSFFCERRRIQNEDQQHQEYDEDQDQEDQEDQEDQDNVVD